MKLTEFDYHLPENLIAQYPLHERSHSRLLTLNRKNNAINHHTFIDIIDFLQPGDLLVFNETCVVPARIYAKRNTGGHIECFLERFLNDNQALIRVRSSKTLKPQEKIYLEKENGIEIIAKQMEFYLVKSFGMISLAKLFEKYGHMPLPSYIDRSDEQIDHSRYQTIYAKTSGAVAAPTAGLHFDENLLKKLQQHNIQFGFTLLHVGSGTYQPIRHENILEHHMHAEYCEVSQGLCEQIIATKKSGKRVIAVGTTSLRALETAAKTGIIKAYSGDTNLFIYPGFQFNIVDALITNFHLPKSSLFVLVCAFANMQMIKNAYQEAIENQYRFYSYGDAMMIF